MVGFIITDNRMCHHCF